MLSDIYCRQHKMVIRYDWQFNKLFINNIKCLL